MSRRKGLSIPGHVWQQPSGRWSGRVYLPDGRRRQISRDTREEVEDALIAIDRQRRLGQYVPPSDFTVEELIERWLERGELYGRWKPITLRQYRSIAQHHIYPALGDLPIQSVTHARLQHWLDGISRHAGPSVTAHCVSVVNGAFRDAVKQEIIESNPAADLERAGHRKKKLVTWSLADVQRVVEYLEGECQTPGAVPLPANALRGNTAQVYPVMWLAIYHLMLGTGMRQGELRALRWRDVDLSTRTLHIRSTMTQDAAGHLVVGESTKTGAIRAVALSDRPYGAIARWYESQTIRPHNPAVDFVFATTIGKPLGLDRWQKQHARIIAATGVPRITLHGLRHSFASLALAQGMPVKVVSDILGHARIVTTMDTYQHVSVDLQRSLLETMDAQLFGNVAPIDATNNPPYGRR